MKSKYLPICTIARSQAPFSDLLLLALILHTVRCTWNLLLNNTMIIFISVHFIVGCNRQSDSDSHRGDWLRKDNSDHPVSGRGWLHHDRKNRLHSAASCRRHVRGKKSVGRIWMSSRSRGKFGWKLFIGQKIKCIGSRALQHLIEFCHIDIFYCHIEKENNSISSLK